MNATLARRLKHLELAGVVLLLVAALLPRIRDLRGPFDREFEGWQGAFFTIGAINYERLGLLRAGGYPVINLDLGDRASPGAGLWDEPQSWFVYGNHPPLVPLAAWAALQAFGGDDWNQAWHEGRPPEGVEPIVRLPFLATHLLGLLAFWWAVRTALGAQRAMLALAVLAVTPVSVMYATLVNYENPALLFIALAFGFYARALRSGRRRDFAGFGASLACGSAVTFAPLLFLPAWAVHSWLARGLRRAALVGLVGAACGLAPVAAHALWWRRSLRGLGQPEPAGILARARELWQPLTSGEAPLSTWFGLQWERWLVWIGPAILVAAFVGAVLALTRARREAAPDDLPGLGLVWLAGGMLVQLGFYRHTLDPQHSFLLFLAPGCALLAAGTLDALAPALLRLRAGTGPLVLATFTLAIPGLLQSNALRRELRAPPDQGGASWGLPDSIGRELRSVVPAGAFALYPDALGWNFAVRYYAWRSLWPTTSRADPAPAFAARTLGLAEAATVLVLPKVPPPSASAQSDALREWAAETSSAPIDTSAGYEVWASPDLP